MSYKKKISHGIKRFINYEKVLQKETDRGCILVIASIIDYELQFLFETKFIKDKTLLKKIFSFNGFVGTFSSKVDLAFALGYLSKKHYWRIGIIRSIRNKFGHSFENISFRNKQIASQIRLLKLGVTSKNSSLRTILLDAVFDILFTMHVERSMVFQSSEKDDYAEVPIKIINLPSTYFPDEYVK